MLDLTFEQWALIADIYTPLLALWSVRLILREPAQSRKISLTALMVTICIVYVSRAIDEWLGIWPTFGSDYSTHTSVALALVVHIAIKVGVRGKLIAVGSLLAYLQLMNHQDYHTYLDMMSTTIYLLPLFWVSWLHFGTREKSPSRTVD
ncbi:hypothetical protein VIN01S_08250 [Vibrio inusitatus NBRC 102082]|uniref:Uncharacterized protein n=1 Tax=Vibrio inusitatus NBRC 102082 TaxID=1219070 RepID=A0A4Y3HSU4_9VIBR|nr:hypothetical protein [Vibrio inusitatus]GEA50021.1 hypothetical protein VIN01S_08250 [Vibrio inusitatus NBRC 102082]